MKRVLPWIQIGLLAVVAAGVVTTAVQVHELDARITAIEQAPVAAPAAVAAVPRRGGPRGRAMPMGVAEAAPPVAPVIDDHLWSEDGRAAIDDVVAEREERERDKMRERWQQMMAYQTDKTVGQVTSELSLDEPTSEALRELVSRYSEVKSQRWRRMRDDDVDPIALQEEAEAAREQFEEDVTALLGEDGLAVLTKAFEGGRRF